MCLAYSIKKGKELTGGIYFGDRGRKDNGNTAFDTCTYSRNEIKRLAIKGFEIAMKRSNYNVRL